MFLGKKEKNIFLNRLVLKRLLNFWTVLTMAFFLADFFSGHRFDISASSIGIIYLAILGIYTSEKEYVRWRYKFQSKFAGEGFVIAWTIIMAVFVVVAPLSGDNYKVPEEFAVMYTAIIGVFAVSHHSKDIRQRK